MIFSTHAFLLWLLRNQAAPTAPWPSAFFILQDVEPSKKIQPMRGGLKTSCTKRTQKNWPLFAQVDTSTQTLKVCSSMVCFFLLACRWIGITVIGDCKSLTNHITIMLNISVTILQWLTCGRHLWKQKTDVKIVGVQPEKKVMANQNGWGSPGVYVSSYKVRLKCYGLQSNSTGKKYWHFKINLNKALLISEHNGHHHKPAIKNSHFKHQQRWI